MTYDGPKFEMSFLGAISCDVARAKGKGWSTAHTRVLLLGPIDSRL
jgi:hypothetical protein